MAILALPHQCKAFQALLFRGLYIYTAFYIFKAHLCSFQMQLCSEPRYLGLRATATRNREITSKISDLPESHKNSLKERE